MWLKLAWSGWAREIWPMKAKVDGQSDFLRATVRAEPILKLGLVNSSDVKTKTISPSLIRTNWESRNRKQTRKPQPSKLALIYPMTVQWRRVLVACASFRRSAVIDKVINWNGCQNLGIIRNRRIHWHLVFWFDMLARLVCIIQSAAIHKEVCPRSGY